MNGTSVTKALPKSPHERRRVLAAHLINEIENEMSERDFQRDFFESVADQFKKTGSISENQITALNRIYERVTR